MPPISTAGHAILGMGPRMGQLGIAGIGTEILYAFIIIVCSLMIYFETKDLYDLSKHKGIQYFRFSFLFFAIAYFFRSFIKFIIGILDVDDILRINPFGFGLFTLFVFIFFSSLALLFLIYSIKWKKWDKIINGFIILPLISFVLAITAVIFNHILVYLFIHLVLLLFALGVLYLAKSSKRKNNLYKVYALLFVFWVLNILDLFVPNVLQYFQLLIYLFSSFIFLLILYKVTKNTGPT